MPGMVRHTLLECLQRFLPDVRGGKLLLKVQGTKLRSPESYDSGLIFLLSCFLRGSLCQIIKTCSHKLLLTAVEIELIFLLSAATFISAFIASRRTSLPVVPLGSNRADHLHLGDQRGDSAAAQQHSWCVLI